MEANDDDHERFEFHLPRVNIGVADGITRSPEGAFPRDTISFTLEGHIWKLRCLVDTGEALLPPDVAMQEAKAKGTPFKADLKSDHAILEIPTVVISQAEAEETANSIGWLLGLALGQRVTWSEIGIRKSGHRRMVKARTISLPTKASGCQPINNQAGGEITTFLETAYPIFIKDQQWWKFTLHWFALAYENSTVEVSGMIPSMLLDRISSWRVEGHAFEKQIGTDLDECLSDPARKAELGKELGETMQRFAKNWNPDRTESLLGVIRGWNNSPSFKKKLSTAFALAGLKPPPPLLTRARNALMHTGSLPDLNHDYIVNYDREVHQSIVVLLLSILNYDGMFFARDRGMFSIRDFRLNEAPPSGQQSDLSQ